MAEGQLLRSETIRYITYDHTAATYKPIGTTGDGLITGAALTATARQFWIQNLTNSGMMFSLDGINDNFFLPALAFYVSDITTNQDPQAGGFFMGMGRMLHVRYPGAAPTSGTIYFSTFNGMK